MKLLRPPPENVPFGLRAMLMIATADGPLRPGAANLIAGAQRALLGTDITIEGLAPITPAELAAEVVDPALRLQLVQGMLVVSLADGPSSRAQMDRVDSFAAALRVEAPELRSLRLLADDHMGFFKIHFFRHSHLARVAAQQLEEGGLLAPIKGLLIMRGYTEDRALAARYRALEGLPKDTLGAALMGYLERNGFSPPGEKGGFPESGIYHDIGHVLSGYGTDPQGELEMCALQAGYMKTHPFFMLLFGAITFSAGINVTPLPQPNTTGILATPGLPDRIFAALERGGRMRVDLSDHWDHWAYMPMPLEVARAELGLT